MAILSSSRRGMAFPGMAALLMVAALALAGCGNDNPGDNGGKMKVDLRPLLKQMGGSSSGGGGMSAMGVGVDDSPATTAVKSLIIGAVVITFTDTPLDEGTAITTDLTNKLADDVINSINYFSIVDLPTGDNFVEFKVPPPGAGHWQVAAIGTRNRILTYDDLNNDDVAIYYGFTPQFFTTSGTSGPDVTITMNRACLIDTPPKGCATFDENGNGLITPDVTVYKAFKNGVQVMSLGGVANPAEATLTAALGGVGPGDIVKVTMTHPSDPNYDAGCVVGAADLTDPCVGISTIRYE